MKRIFATLLVSQLSAGIAAPPAAIPEAEQPHRLTEGAPLIRSLAELERRGLNAGATTIDLWSGSYWPHYQGALAARYRDPNYLQLMAAEVQFPRFKEYFDRTPILVYRNDLSQLSPAEKYDLLVGDPQMSLTRFSWEIGEKALQGNRVPTWRGICDGWAAASQMMPRPKRSVTLTAPTGELLTFTPDDIMALGSQLYARAQRNVLFFGKRCHSPLLFFTSACSGANPGAFHLALTNRVGNLKKTFIADTSRGSEVWNYPVRDYKVSYYNVFTDEESPDFRPALEVFDKKKRFRKRESRHPQTRFIVGVKTVVNFQDMRDASLLLTNSTAEDKVMERTYLYDLELDANFNVLGGERAGRDFPDFFWAPNDGTYPQAISERRLGRPRGASEIVLQAQESSKVGQPLSLIVERLYEAAR
jgi:hypothetical protein